MHRKTNDDAPRRNYEELVLNTVHSKDIGYGR